MCLKTDAGVYEVTKASAAYRPLYQHFAEQAEICFEVYQAVSPKQGGNPQASFDEVVAKVARSKVRPPRCSARAAFRLPEWGVVGSAARPCALQQPLRGLRACRPGSPA